MIAISYKHEVLASNGSIDVDGFSCIEFENIGDDNAVLNGSIPLTVGGAKRSFINRPFEVVKERFMINFDDKASNKKVLVIKTYYDEIPNELAAKKKPEQKKFLNPGLIIPDNACLIDNSQPELTYFGYIGTNANSDNTSQASFAIKKVSFKNGFYTIKWANGNNKSDKVWDKREKYAYSFLIK